MKKFSNFLLILCSVLVVIAGSVFFLYRNIGNQQSDVSHILSLPQSVEATASDNVYGWAWGPNFGWIGMNCLNDYNGDGRITLSSPDENHCASGSFGVNIGGSGVFDDDSWAWSNWFGWLDFAPNSSQATDPEGGVTADCELNTDGTISGWARTDQAHWSDPTCYNWMKMRGDIMPEAAFDTYTWNAGTSTFQGTFPDCTGCDYYKKYCEGGDNDGQACSIDADCSAGGGTCDYKTVESTVSGAVYRCDICYSDTVGASNLGSGKLCVKSDSDTLCSGCTDNASPPNDTCTDCPRCYEYGVAVDYSKNRLSGWGWSMLHEESGVGSCSGSVGIGWIAFHAISDGVFAPWLQTAQGSVYSVGSIGSESTFRPPGGRYNATYAIHAGGTITNFYSTSGAFWEEEGYDDLEYPDVDKNYSNILGKIDFPGMQAGFYGEVEEITSASDIDSVLAGKVYVMDGDLTISSATTFNPGSSGTPDGAGTVIVKGNLTIDANILYSSSAVNKITYLPSIAFIVLGDVTVASTVTDINAALIILGDGDPISCPVLSSASSGCGRFSTGQSYTDPLEVNGLIMAKQFNLERLYVSLSEGAEQFNYDGRLLANTPPGMEDMELALPEWNEVAP